jgi:hypothetical protein
MSIEKSLNPAPQGIESMIEDLGEPDIEIEIEDPESVTLKMGDLEIEFEPGEESSEDFNANLAEHISAEELAMIASDLIGDYDEDVASRKDWIQTYVDGLELLGMKLEERAEPWEGASGVYHPLLSEALGEIPGRNHDVHVSSRRPRKNSDHRQRNHREKRVSQACSAGYELSIDRCHAGVPPGARKNALGARSFRQRL